MTSAPSDIDLQVQELLRKYAAQDYGPAHLCDQHASDKIAYRVISEDLSAHVLTYGELQRDSKKFARALAELGIGQGDRVATLMGKSEEYLIAILAIWRLGAVHVPLFTAFAPPAISLRLHGSQTKAIVCDTNQQHKLAGQDGILPGGCLVITTATGYMPLPGAIRFADLIASYQPGFPAVTLGGDAPFILIYTSGTTGKPKGVLVPGRALASFHAYAEFGLGLRDGDVFWNAADPGWAYGLYFGILGTFSTGVTSILYKGGFSADATFEILSHQAVTNFTAAPTVYRALRASGLSPSKPLKLRCASSAGEPLTPDVNEWAVSVLGVPVHDHYGQTEVGMLINNHHHPALRRPLKPGSMGHVMPGWTGAILKQDSDEIASVGEVGRVAMELTRSPLAWFKGYTDDPDKSAEKFSVDGRWYITGDVGRVDGEGYFYFSSRDDDVIIMAGYRIGPVEIESVLRSHPAVRECAVIAAPDEVRGEVLEAVIVLYEGHSGTAELSKELQTWVKTHYAAHAYPRRVHYVRELPRTPSGKVQRFVIREQLRGRSREASS